MSKRTLGYIAIVVFVIAFIIVIVSVLGRNKGGDDQFEINQAEVLSVDIIQKESFPVQVDAQLTGVLNDACVEYDDTVITRDDFTFSLYVTTKRPIDAMCAQVLGEFNETVALPVEGLPQGEYTVIANGVEAQFSLLVDNFINDFEETK